MTLPGVISGSFQFCAGPQQERFYACTRHIGRLMARESPTSVFWRVAGDVDRLEDADDGVLCDWCRGEDGP